MTKQELCDRYLSSFASIVAVGDTVLDSKDKWWKLYSSEIGRIAGSLREVRKDLIELDSDLRKRVRLPNSHTAKSLASREYDLIFSIRELAHRSMNTTQDMIQSRRNTYQFRMILLMTTLAVIVSLVSVLVR
ncbi:MAG: hypothetical protein GF309_03360 [Candidatus Lokiarchaeota archaeon]|nr:hypothetical protein [Candidatus Lokiarchaeota archaeon]